MSAKTVAGRWEEYFLPRTYDPATRQGVLRNSTGATLNAVLQRDEAVRFAVRLQLLPEHLGRVRYSVGDCEYLKNRRPLDIAAGPSSIAVGDQWPHEPGH